MMRPRLAVVGAGGHARVILDVFRRGQVLDVVGLLDRTLPEGERFGYRVLGTPEEIERIAGAFGITAIFVAIGDNWRRAQVTEGIAAGTAELDFPSAIHPSAVVGDDVQVGAGTSLLAGSVLGPGSRIGRGTVINTNASVDHDCSLGEYSSISPGATLAGGVEVGPYVVVGPGACVIEQVRIGEHTVVGAGAVVTRDLPSNVVAYGNPAKVVRRRDAGAPYLRPPRA